MSFQIGMAFFLYINACYKLKASYICNPISRDRAVSRNKYGTWYLPSLVLINRKQVKFI